MNDQEPVGAEDNEEVGDQAAEPQDGDATVDLSGFMEGARQASTWRNSLDRQLEPVRSRLRELESTRRAIDSVAGRSSPIYQAALDLQRQHQAIAAPVLALQSDLSDLYDWHRHIANVVARVALPRTLLDQLAAAAALFLPANLNGLDTKDLYAILEMSEDDGMSLAWAPRTEIVKTLLPLGTRQERYALLAESRDDVLDDVEASLQLVTHHELTGMVTILGAATRTARAGFSEGAQALAGNVLETAMKKHGNAWIRRSFPQAAYPPKGGHHGTIGGALGNADDWGDLTLLQFKHYLVLAGMRNAFGPGATQDTFNRHLGAHQASPDTYRPEFTLPTILLVHALLHALDQDLERPDEGDGA
ncbi:hypothetical protein [Streptomyces sp. NPDC002547]